MSIQQNDAIPLMETTSDLIARSMRLAIYSRSYLEPHIISGWQE